jgi:hypothetical protein
VTVAYFIQSHRGADQVLRLAATLRRGSPAAVLVVGHCPSGEALDDARLRSLGVLSFRHRQPARRGYWSLLEPYFDAVELLRREGVDYDWLVYLSGQCYPVRPLAEIERALAGCERDGFLRWRPALARAASGRRRQGRFRYYYRYRDCPRSLPLLRLLRRLNAVQPLLHVHLTYGPRLGLRARRLPYGPGLVPYVGTQWATLRRPCAEQLLDVASGGGPLVAHLRQTVCPDEAFAPTVLVNHGKWRLENDDLRFADFAGSRDGHPRTLGQADAERLHAGPYHFARKFDLAGDVAPLDWLDRHIS